MRRVVALGGGHGTAVALRAARRYAGEVTAIVSVADDGGSTGRLREQLDVVALGDLRRCLVALAGDGSRLAAAFEHRFSGGDLAGHALGNLVLAGMVEASGGLVEGIDETAALLGAVGRVLPATREKVALKAVSGSGEVNGQVAVSHAGRIEHVSLVPEGCTPPAEAIAAIARADQVVIGPGSLFTSVLAAAAVEGIAAAIATTAAQRVYVCNLRPQLPETEGFGVEEHVGALAQHGVEIDVVLWDPSTGMRLGRPSAPAVARGLADPGGTVHDPVRLAEALSDLLASCPGEAGPHDGAGRPGGRGLIGEGRQPGRARPGDGPSRRRRTTRSERS